MKSVWQVSKPNQENILTLEERTALREKFYGAV
jgi:hypothetical protein